MTNPQTTLDGLDPRLIAWWEWIRPAWREASGLDLRLLETVRTTERQAWLYAQGRTRPGSVVTWRTHSNHQGGLAVDVAIVADGRVLMGANALELAAYRWLAELGERDGVVSLGRRAGKDWFHFEVSR